MRGVLGLICFGFGAYFIQMKFFPEAITESKVMYKCLSWSQQLSFGRKSYHKLYFQ